MKVGIHQPQYLPWLAYFLKIAKCDIFIILDHVDFQKNGLQNRNQIKTDKGYQWLTVPVQHKLGQKINDIKINNQLNWSKKHIKSIINHYSRSKYFDFYINDFKKIYEMNWNKLVDLNLAFIYLILNILKIKTKIIKSSALNVEGKSSQLIINICKKVGAKTYISGTGAREYLNQNDFKTNKIELILEPPVFPKKYDQVYNNIGFLNDLSVVDIIMNCGKEWENYC